MTAILGNYKYKMLFKLPLVFILLTCFLLLGLALANEPKRTRKRTKSRPGKEAMARKSANERGSRTVVTLPRSDLGCTAIGGICQNDTYICQGRYLKDKCSGERTRQCCMPAAAWDVLCAGSHHNRIRACDKFGCGGFNSNSKGTSHRSVDVVCDDYGVINAPFTGKLEGPAGRRVGDTFNYDGIKISNSVHCVKIFNIRAYRYNGFIIKGEALGYLLPLQESYPGITSHLNIQMCDHSDPSPFI